MRDAFLAHFIVFDMLVILMVYVSEEYFEMSQNGSPPPRFIWESLCCRYVSPSVSCHSSGCGQRTLWYTTLYKYWERQGKAKSFEDRQ